MRVTDYKAAKVSTTGSEKTTAMRMRGKFVHAINFVSSKPEA